MEVHNSLHTLQIENPVVTIGNFDGIHLGHRAIIKRVCEIANDIGGESVLIVFWPHPRIVLQKENAELRFLTLQEEKIILLEQTGIDHLVILPFTLEFSQLSYQTFIEDYLFKSLKTKHLLVGFNHQFGKNREGNFDSLLVLAGELGFAAEQQKPELINGIQVSSSAIRTALQSGDVNLAGDLLGYRFFLSGTVVQGKKIGRDIGFPTANLEVNNSLKLIPGEGVYAVCTETDGRMYHGMMNIGRKPTINPQTDKQSLEVHLFDFSGDLYSKEIKVIFVDRIREERKFSGLEELRIQLEADKQESKRIFSKVHTNICKIQ